MGRRRVGAMATALAAIIVTTVSPAAGAAPVDPATLYPQPPAGATCETAGSQVLCRTEVVRHTVGEEGFELPCGVFYETLDYRGRGLRWYSDGLLTRRTVFETAEGFWSLSREGTGRRVLISSHVTAHNEGIDASAPESQWPETRTGMDWTVRADTGRVLFIFAGRQDSSGHHGVGDWDQFFNGDVPDQLCAALT